MPTARIGLASFLNLFTALYAGEESLCFRRSGNSGMRPIKTATVFHAGADHGNKFITCFLYPGSETYISYRTSQNNFDVTTSPPISDAARL